MSADSAAVQVFAVKAHLQFLFCFHDDSENIWSQKHLHCPLVCFFFPLHLPVSNNESKNNLFLIFRSIFRGLQKPTHQVILWLYDNYGYDPLNNQAAHLLRSYEAEASRLECAEV